MWSARNRSTRSRGFTLVELLVVIGIIALLISILLPTLVSAQRAAKMLKCSSQLRTIGQLLALHATDHRGYYPMGGIIYGPYSPSAFGDGEMQKYDYFRNNSPTDTPMATAIPEALAPYLNIQPVSTGWQPIFDQIQAQGPLRDAFTCPSDLYALQAPPGTKTTTARKWVDSPGNPWGGGGGALYAFSSYALNQHIFGFTTTPLPTGQVFADLRGKISAVPNPSETVLMMDAKSNIRGNLATIVANGSVADVYLNTNTGSNPSVQYATAGLFDLVRHRGLANILYADGHVDSQPILSTGATAASGAVGSSGNSPSGFTGPGQLGGGGLGGVSVARNFR